MTVPRYSPSVDLAGVREETFGKTHGVYEIFSTRKDTDQWRYWSRVLGWVEQGAARGSLKGSTPKLTLYVLVVCPNGGRCKNLTWVEHGQHII
jgi:hypothetical protein